MSAITFTGNAVPVVRTPRLRLTARGRAVFTTLAAAPLVAIALFIGLSGGNAVAGQDAPAATLEYVSIAPGQSLWQLAEQVAPQADPREVVADILSLNQLGSADVQPGQKLAIPAQYSR
jgi:hypothetical protein